MSGRARTLVLRSLVLSLILASSVWAEDEAASSNDAKSQGLAGPSSTTGQLQKDGAVEKGAVRLETIDDALAAYFARKTQFTQKSGLSVGTDYTTLVQGGGPPVGSEDFAASGRWALYGSWALVDRSGSSPGELVFKVENRHTLGTAVAPGSLSQSLGTDLTTAVAFSDADWLYTNLYWHQQLDGGRFAVLVGQLDPTDYIDTYPLVSPWTDFLNGAFSNSPIIAMPNQTLGMAVGALPGDHLYGVAGFADPDGDPAHPFDTFFADGDIFAHGEVGWVASMEKRHQDNFHVTGWYVTARPRAGVGSGWGLTFNASWRLAERWTPFVRGGFSAGDTAAAKGNVATGVAVAVRGDDLLGFGLAWTRPSQGVGPDQYTGELFYRLHVLRNLAVTPDVQVILNPVGRSSGTAVAIAGLRARLNF